MQRFIAIQEGPNVWQPFDSVEVRYTHREWLGTALYARPVLTRDVRPFDDTSINGFTFSGALLERRNLGPGNLSFFGAELRNDIRRLWRPALAQCFGPSMLWPTATGCARANCWGFAYGNWILKLTRCVSGQVKPNRAKGAPWGMTKEVEELLAPCVKDKGPEDPVFTWPSGKPMKDFRASWYKIAAAAGLPDLLLHDFRRSAARNLVRAGVERDTARRITDHKTDSIFSRYNIVAQEDLLDAARKLEASRKAKQA